MDTDQLSKIERGLRQLKREQIRAMAHILKADEDELLILWLSPEGFFPIENGLIR
jgi:endonuclease III-like uncharacterized protein